MGGKARGKLRESGEFCTGFGWIKVLHGFLQIICAGFCGGFYTRFTHFSIVFSHRFSP